MSDGTSGSVGVLQPGSPDRQIDNSIMADGTYRQRVDAPTLADWLGNIEGLLTQLVAKTSQQNVAGQIRALLETGSTTAVTGTLTGVTTVSTVTNVAQVGGLSANYDQVSAMNILALGLRDRITVA